MRMPEQLCWSCAKACGWCSWSRKTKPEPVPGWTATPCKIKMAINTYAESYAITKCPEYVMDCEKSTERRKFYALAAILYAAKKNDAQIAKALGVGATAILRWRHRTGRPAIAKGGRQKGEEGR